MKHHRLHERTWSLLRFVLRPYLKRRFNYTYEECNIEGPCLVMANHDTNWDPLFLGCAFPKQMYFVASEHIFRWGFVSKLLNFFLAPISRMKGKTAADTAMTILRRLKKGYNVAMFANGSRSFNGISEDILPSTGKLARSGGVTLVTYRLEGGYFTEPRWNTAGIRKGKIKGKVMGVYSAEELKKMSVDEVNELIRRDLYVDAYEIQQQEWVEYKSSNAAESLETVLCICPKCGRIGYMRSLGKDFWCSYCKYSVVYGKYGYFGGPEVIYDNVTSWDKFQTERFIAMADEAKENEPIFHDNGYALIEVGADHSSKKLGSGPIALYRDRFECCGMSFPLHELGGFALHGPVVANFSHDGHSYELKPSQTRCTRKYQTVIHHLHSRGAEMQS